MTHKGAARKQRPPKHKSLPKILQRHRKKEKSSGALSKARRTLARMGKPHASLVQRRAIGKQEQQPVATTAPANIIADDGEEKQLSSTGCKATGTACTKDDFNQQFTIAFK